MSIEVIACNVTVFFETQCGCSMSRLTISGEEETRLKLAAIQQSTSISEDDEPSVYVCSLCPSPPVKQNKD